MENLVEEYERNGLKIKIYYDETPESPREWDNLGTMICSHRRYSLGDEQFNADDYEDWEELRQRLKNERGAVIVLPLGLYDHSGITMYVGDNHDKWDGGQVGFIYCTQDQIDNEFGGDKEKAEECLRNEVKTYDEYLRGEVYGYIITDTRLNEEVDSLWGIYGIDDAKEEANSIADSYKHPRDSVLAKKAGEIHE